MESSSRYRVNGKQNCYIPGAMFGPFSFINIYSGKEVFDCENGLKNMLEVAVTLRILQLIYKECASSKHKVSIAVLSPYPAQLQCLQQKVEMHYENNKLIKVKVGFLHDYQGEEDIILISTVGAEDECNELEKSRLNTDDYFKSERRCLWVLGDERVLRGSYWEPLVLDAKARQCFFQAHEHKDLAKVIVEVKKDLHELDELITGDTSLFRSTTWKVLFSSKFITSFSNIESWEKKKLVLLMLLKLSTGWRPKRSSTAAPVCESPYFKVMREFKVKGLHLLCTIDIVKDSDYVQALKVWDILPFHEMGELVKRLEGIIGMYTPEYIDHCKSRCGQRDSEYPMNWPATFEISQYKFQNKNFCEEDFMDGSNTNGCVENVKVSESLILMKFYSFSSGAVNSMISGCDGGGLGLPLELTEQEKDVVSFNKSSFILGRSGTGKTTVLTTKLYRNEQLHHLACEGFHEKMDNDNEVKQDVLRQLFFTLSPRLCYAVKQHVGEFKRLTCGGSSSFQGSSARIDDIEEMMLSEDIPDHFNHLPQKSYPLIITFHRFLLMLDGTVGRSYFERFPYVRQLICGNKTSNSRLSGLEQYMRFNDVTYERFCSTYWHHFNNKLRKSFDPSTIYTEIMSVIKGLMEGKTPNGILSKEDYVSLCGGRTSILDAQKREIIYSIFEQYEKMKTEKENFDLADLVNDLHQRLEFEGYKGDSMDYVYIDEVQDLTMRQIMLFKYVCTNVQEGYAFSGDTAQAIAKGIGFRFEDIRSLFFSKFLLCSEKGKMSKLFQLSENFRTHSGVLSLAQSVISLLCHFFPLFIDALRPETSQINGELPILLETDSNDNVIQTIFGTNGDGCQKVIGFGAEQVILVREEYLKEKVVDIVGKNALVLTIMESKGLEFQDVLLYDFFTTSSFSNEWRIIYEYMKEKDLLNLSSASLHACFDMEKHIVLCGELKQLYVAITRTRQRLWISETSGFCQPIFDYWKKLSLVEVKHINDLSADLMQTPSSKDEWRSRGVKLYYENNFKMAQMCFLKAGDTYSERLAEAHQLRANASGTHASQTERKKLFNEAGQLFASLDKHMLAAECFYEIEDYQIAGEEYVRASMFEKAGNCFSLAKSYERAVEEYEKAEAFAMCFSCCADGNLFEMGFQLKGRWRGCRDAELEFLKKGARYYFGIKDIKSMMTFVRCFYSKSDIHAFLTKRRCFDEIISLQVEWGNFEEAAKVARLKPDPVLEADLLQMGGLYKESSLILLWHVFSETLVDGSFANKDELLMKAVLTAKRCCDDFFYQFVCRESKILSEAKTQEEVLKKGLEFIDCYRESGLALGLDQVKTTQEIDKFEKDVLDQMHSFYKSVNRVNELLILLEIRGKFVEAAKIANENDQSIEAALRRLWYVFFGSLWACGKRAWPLKDFKQKHKLLHDAKLYVERDPDSLDSVLVLTEISILSNAEISLCEMWRHLSEIPKERSLRIHFLVSRRILDVHLDSNWNVNAGIETWVDDVKHLEGEFSKNIFSIEGLVYFWSYWKELIRELIEQSSKMGHFVEDNKMYEDFICNYFGVRKYDGDKKGSYVVLDVKAHWVKEMNTCTKQFHIINARKFSSVASQYWYSELLFVSEKLLKKLQSLHDHSTVKKFSTHQRMRILINLFKVTECLQKCMFQKARCRARFDRIVDQSLQFCINEFMNNVFHINWKNAQSKEMILMRGNETFLNMLKVAINVNSKLPKGPSCRHLGKIAMIFLAYRMTDLNDDIMRTVGRFSSQNWKNLYDEVYRDKSSSKNVEVAVSLHNVLKETTLDAGWLTADDCLSPACFLYLIERLLILSLCFRGYVFMTRSSCVEWFTYEEWGMSLNKEDLVICSDTMKAIRHSLASMVSGMLNSPDDLLEWVKRSKEESYEILVLRLILLLSMICVNLGQHCHTLCNLLENQHFASVLPSTFAEGLIKGLKEDCLVDALAVACEKIDNPLVIVSFTKDSSMAPCGNAISLNMTAQDLSRERLIKMLYSSPEFPLLSKHISFV